METRTENLEKDVSGLKGEMSDVKMEMGKMRANIEKILELLMSRDKGKEKMNGEGSGEKFTEETGQNSHSKPDTGSKDRYDFKWQKLELPVFTGVDPFNWLLRVDRYFALNQVVEEEKIQAAVICMDGKALSWYHWNETINFITSWSEFKVQLQKRFRDSQEGNGYESLVALNKRDQSQTTGNDLSSLQLRWTE